MRGTCTMLHQSVHATQWPNQLTVSIQFNCKMHQKLAFLSSKIEKFSGEGTPHFHTHPGVGASILSPMALETHPQSPTEIATTTEWHGEFKTSVKICIITNVAYYFTRLDGLRTTANRQSVGPYHKTDTNLKVSLLRGGLCPAALRPSINCGPMRNYLKVAKVKKYIQFLMLINFLYVVFVCDVTVPLLL